MKTTTIYLQKYANQLRERYYPDMPRVIVNKVKIESRFGGKAYGINEIVIAPWMLADKAEAKSTIRHEFAHNILCWLKLPRKIAHGKEFHQILKRIAPKMWRQDLHWNATPAITQARQKAGIKSIERQSLKWRYFTCGNPNCTANSKRTYGYKRIPYYIKAGLFASCEDCGCPKLIEIGGKHEVFKSVH